MGNRYTIFIAIFILSLAWIAHHSWTIDGGKLSSDAMSLSNEKLDSIATFNQVKYFNLAEFGKQLSLVSTRLDMINNGERLNFDQVDGKFFNKDAKEFIYKADSAKLKKNTQDGSSVLTLNGEVEVVSIESQMQADKAIYYHPKNEFELIGKVNSKTVVPSNGDRIAIKSERAYAKPNNNYLEFSENVNGVLNRKRRFEGKITFKSNEMGLDLNQSKVSLQGDVALKKQEVSATSLRGEIFLENYNKKLKYYALYDDVKVRENLKSVKGGKREAYAERLEGFNREGKLVFSGNPKVIQGDNVIQGNRITLYEDTEVVEVDDSTSIFNLEEKK